MELNMYKRFFNLAYSFIKENKLAGIIIAIISFIFVLTFSFTDIYEEIELTLYDFRFRLKPTIEEWEKLVFIDVDENSITRVGEFPWTRDKYAKGLYNLRGIGIKQQNFDITFPDWSPIQVDRENYISLKNKLKKVKKVGQNEIENIMKNNDIIFANALERTNIGILTYQFNSEPHTTDVKERHKTKEFQEAIKNFKAKSSIKIPKDKLHLYSKIRNPDIVDISYPIPELMNSTKGFGFSNRDTDVDGAFRKIRLVILFEERIYFNLGLSMLLDICNVKMKNIEIIPGDKIVLKDAFNPVSHEQRDIEIPIDDQGMVYVNWTDRMGTGAWTDSFKHLPFYMIYEYESDMAEDVYENLFSEVESPQDSIKMSNFSQELKKLRSEYLSSKDATIKKKKWSRITQIQKDIIKIKMGYLNKYRKEVSAVEKELKKKFDPALAEEFKIMREDLIMIEMVIRVEALQDHIALTGLTAAGTIDIGIMPLNKEYPRVGIYHNIINTILQNEYIMKVGNYVNYMIMLIIAIFMGYLIQHLNARNSILAIIISLITVNIVIVFLFMFLNLWVDQFGIILSLILPSVSISAIKFLQEETQKRFIKSAFSRYLSPGVIDQIIDDPESLELGGEDREITIFFSDVAGFSSISEKLTPKELVLRLNEYLSEMTDIILSYEGTVDKYEGDAIMAFWGAPKQFDDHALKGCFASIDMKKRLSELQEKWRKEGIEELYARMGLNSGRAVVGNMGSKSRMDYTAMGDSVNLASRLEGANKHYSTKALLSETTYKDVLDHVEARKLDKIRVVGKSEPVQIYELLGKKGALPDRMYEMLDKYYVAMKFFDNREWKKAKKYFREALGILDDDGPSATYIERCDGYLKKEPPKNWDGVYTLKSK